MFAKVELDKSLYFLLEILSKTINIHVINDTRLQRESSKMCKPSTPARAVPLVGLPSALWAPTDPYRVLLPKPDSLPVRGGGYEPVFNLRLALSSPHAVAKLLVSRARAETHSSYIIMPLVHL
jgi:hypothetical protein